MRKARAFDIRATELRRQVDAAIIEGGLNLFGVARAFGVTRGYARRRYIFLMGNHPPGEGRQRLLFNEETPARAYRASGPRGF